MAYTVKIRTLPGSPMLCEYECPVHGRLEHLVERDENGDPPEAVECDVAIEDRHGGHAAGCAKFATVMQMAECDCPPIPCGERSDLVVSAPNVKFWSRDPVPIGYASKSDEKDPRALDTEPLATGKMTRAEWDKYQRGITLERRYQRRLKEGRISKRIQVGGG